LQREEVGTLEIRDFHLDNEQRHILNNILSVQLYSELESIKDQTDDGELFGNYLKELNACSMSANAIKYISDNSKLVYMKEKPDCIQSVTCRALKDAIDHYFAYSCEKVRDMSVREMNKVLQLKIVIEWLEEILYA
jgi:hypothetical protein